MRQKIYEQNKNHATHRRSASLRELSLEAQVAYLLANLMALQHTDDGASKEDDYKQSQHNGYGRTERYVLEYTRTRQVIFSVKKSKK